MDKFLFLIFLAIGCTNISNKDEANSTLSLKKTNALPLIDTGLVKSALSYIFKKSDFKHLKMAEGDNILEHVNISNKILKPQPMNFLGAIVEKRKGGDISTEGASPFEAGIPQYESWLISLSDSINNDHFLDYWSDSEFNRNMNIDAKLNLRVSKKFKNYFFCDLEFAEDIEGDDLTSKQKGKIWAFMFILTNEDQVSECFEETLYY